MYSETKRRTYFQIGLFLGFVGVLLALIGISYVNTPTLTPTLDPTSNGGYATQKAVVLWGGILLVCFALRDITLAYPATRFSVKGMWDTCSAVLTNIFAFLICGAVIGITLWGHVGFFRDAEVDQLSNSAMLVNLITILLLGTLGMLASLVGCILGCFPSSDASTVQNGGEQYAMDNQGFNKQ